MPTVSFSRSFSKTLISSLAASLYFSTFLMIFRASRSDLEDKKSNMVTKVHIGFNITKITFLRCKNTYNNCIVLFIYEQCKACVLYLLLKLCRDWRQLTEAVKIKDKNDIRLMTRQEKWRQTRTGFWTITNKCMKICILNVKCNIYECREDD